MYHSLRSAVPGPVASLDFDPRALKVPGDGGAAVREAPGGTGRIRVSDQVRSVCGQKVVYVRGQLTGENAVGSTPVSMWMVARLVASIATAHTAVSTGG